MFDRLPRHHRSRVGASAAWLIPIALACVLATVPAVSATAHRAAATRSTSPTATAAPTSVALSWAALYMSDDHTYTADDATDLARRFDLVAAMPIALKDDTAAMRAANPDLTLLAYSNATLIRTSAVAGLPERAFAHDAAGRRVTAPGFDSYLMESSDPTWRATANAQCVSRAALGGFDGCLVDMLGLGIFAAGYVSAIPVNPATGAAYTEAEYRDRMTAMDAYYRSASPNLLHVGNAVQNSYRYWQSPVTSRGLTSSMPAAQMEDFLRGAGTPTSGYPTAENWKRNVDVVRDFEASGRMGLFTTKVWSRASDAEIAAWQKYAMASFLMGANGKSYFAFSRSRDKAGASQTNLPYALPRNLGLPLGDMTQDRSGAWTRTFANGMTVVNPTDAVVTVNLPTALKTLDGVVTTALVLPAHSGEIVSGNPVPPAPPAPPVPAVPSDTVAPSAAWGTFTQTGAVLTVAGTAADNVGVSWVHVAVRDQATHLWLYPDGSWGAYAELPTTAILADGTSSRWSTSLRLARGSYGVSLIASDAAGNKNPAPRPWKVVAVKAG